MKLRSATLFVALTPLSLVLATMYIGPVLNGNTPGILPMTWYTPDGHYVEPVIWEHSRYNVKVDGKTYEQAFAESEARWMTELCRQNYSKPDCAFIIDDYNQVLLRLK